MKYHMRIADTESQCSILRTREGLKYKNTVELIVGNTYEVYIVNPKNEKDKKNNGRSVVLLGFNSDFCGNPVVKYADTGKRGTVGINQLKPLDFVVE